jgi:hypothetical protein
MLDGAVYPHFDPTSIIGGDFPLAARPVTIASGQNASGSPLMPGVLLGARSQTSGMTVTEAAKAGNTGNATMALATPAQLANAQPGVYQVVFSSATAFTVYDPKGDDLGVGVNGAAFADQIGFTTTAGGTPMVAGDTLLVTLAPAVPMSASSVANGGNAGNATLALAAVPVLAYAQQGAYLVTMTSPTAFEVTDPFGNPVGAGLIGTAFAGQIGFTISAGVTAMAINDYFTVTLTALTLYVASVATATDGSQIPSCILADDVDTSSGAITAMAYFTGEFAFEELTVDASWTMAQLNQIFANKGQSIFLRSAGLAA